MDEELSLEAFAALAEAMGVPIAAEDRVTMREGYLGLRRMLALLPRDLDFFEEPATIFSAPKAQP
jgi:hypothetical protein